MDTKFQKRFDTFIDERTVKTRSFDSHTVFEATLSLTCKNRTNQFSLVD